MPGDTTHTVADQRSRVPIAGHAGSPVVRGAVRPGRPATGHHGAEAPADAEARADAARAVCR